jgi:hypothetical protein
MFGKGLPNRAVKQKLSGKPFEEYLPSSSPLPPLSPLLLPAPVVATDSPPASFVLPLTYETVLVAQKKYLDNSDLRAPTPPPPSIQLWPPQPPPQASTESPEDEKGLSQYEKNRLAKIASNNAMMEALGIFKPKAAAPSKRTYNKRPKDPDAEPAPRRPKSARTAGVVVNYTDVDENYVDPIDP